ncbi:MAG: hypothetical protein ABEI75_05285 [Halobaculum sp.]
MTSSYTPGVVFWAPDPFRSGDDPRPWLVLASESLPFAGEEYVCAALTTSGRDATLHVGDDWVSGRHPHRSSYCSPWSLATVKHDAVVDPQGDVTERVIRESARYLTENSSVALR